MTKGLQVNNRLGPSPGSGRMDVTGKGKQIVRWHIYVYCDFFYLPQNGEFLWGFSGFNPSNKGILPYRTADVLFLTTRWSGPRG